MFTYCCLLCFFNFEFVDVLISEFFPKFDPNMDTGYLAPMFDIPCILLLTCLAYSLSFHCCIFFFWVHF